MVLLPSEGEKHLNYAPVMLARSADCIVIPPYSQKEAFEASLFRATQGLHLFHACIERGQRELVVDPGL